METIPAMGAKEKAELTPDQKAAVELYEQGLALWNPDINNDLASEQAAKNVTAMKLWYESAEKGYIQAIAQICRNIDRGGFVKDAETSQWVPYYGRSMGLNIDGESGWAIIRRFGQMAIDFGLDDLNSFGNSEKAQETIYTLLAEAYGDDECIGVEPWAADYQKCYDYYLKVADLNFKTYRYVAELFWFGKLDPPEGYTAGEISLECMLKAVESHDATANFYLGLWYLNDDGTGPQLTVPEGETKYTMAVKYLETGREIATHGTIRKTQESLERLTEIYENGEGAPAVPRDLNKALEIFHEMLQEKYYPANQDYINAAARIEAKLTAEKSGGIVVLCDNAALRFDEAPILEEGHVLVPYGPVCEAIGLDAQWDPAAQTVTASSATRRIVLTVGSSKAAVNHDVLRVDAAPRLVNGTVFIPLLFLAEVTGLNVSWDPAARLVSIRTPDGYHPGQAGTVVAPQGKSITFGGYEWIVLEKKSDRMLVVMKDVLEARCYNSKQTQVTWETCEMREYLNGAFYGRFSLEDQKRILKTRIANPYNGYFKTLAGAATEDHIFLLSQEEVDVYFGTSSRASSTWWTRTPGIDQRYQVMMNGDGSKNNHGWRVSNGLGGVRPAMWLFDPIPDPHCKPYMKVIAYGADKLQISFDRPMHAANGAFTVDRDGVDLDLRSIQWSEDQCVITITLFDALTEGTYHVHMRNTARPNMKNEGTVTVSIPDLLAMIEKLLG
ncbi:MAG: stalk domain-containing protein [Oscillospiraceae bacterium]